MSCDDIIMCVDCKTAGLINNTCKSCAREYKILNGVPIYLTKSNTVFREEQYFTSLLDSNYKLINFKKIIPSISVNLSRKKILNEYCNEFKNTKKNILVLGSGNQKSQFKVEYSKFYNLNFVYVDVDINSEVDYYCDAHNLPFIDSCFDLVIVTAVLQHVPNPSLVVEEIYRVLNCEGRVYSEYAFLQHVIEGGYDFSRLTLVGHQRLFNFFTVIKSGLVAGPATVFLWYVENLFILFLPNGYLKLIMKTLIRIPLFWIKYLDYIFVHFKGSIDNASCTYLYAVKQKNSVDDSVIINSYYGNKQLKHV